MSKRIYANPNALDSLTITNRILVLDPMGSAVSWSGLLKMDFGPTLSNWVETDCNLIDADMKTLLSITITVSEAATLSRLTLAKSHAQAIPSWATWTEAQAQTWGATNIGTPLSTGRSALPATLTLATVRTAIIMLLNILDKMWAMQWALARMVIAIRDRMWPDLPQT